MPVLCPPSFSRPLSCVWSNPAVLSQDLPTHPASSMKSALLLQLLLIHLTPQQVPGSPKQHFMSRFWVWALGRDAAFVEMRGSEGWGYTLWKKYSIMFKGPSFTVSKIQVWISAVCLLSGLGQSVRASDFIFAMDIMTLGQLGEETEIMHAY